MAYIKEDKDKVFNSIISEIENGASLRSALRLNNNFSSSTFDAWIKEDEDKSNQYACARDKRTDLIFEQILTIADANENDILGVDDNGRKIINNDVVQRNRLQIDARKWMLGKMNKRKYGDSIDMTSDGDKISSSISVEIIKPT
jgi:hypothetical protein